MTDFKAMMARAKGQDVPPPQPASALPPGVAMMLKSVGLGPYVEAINGLIESGALQRILDFADQVGPINDQLRALRNDVAAIRTILEPGADPGRPGGPVVVSVGDVPPGEHGADVAPGNPDDGSRDAGQTG